VVEASCIAFDHARTHEVITETLGLGYDLGTARPLRAALTRSRWSITNEHTKVVHSVDTAIFDSDVGSNGTRPQRLFWPPATTATWEDRQAPNAATPWM
jgi:hypothetical protein